MDVYTNPQSNTYTLGTKFTYPTDHGGISAIAVKSSTLPLIAAIFALLIQLLFAGLWQLAANLVLFLYAISGPNPERAGYVALVAFWNSHDPWTAISMMVHYVVQMCFNGGQGRVSMRDKWTGIALLCLAVVVAGGGFAASISIPSAMSLGPAAPVHQAAVYVAFVEDVANSTATRMFKLYAPSILRALGSTEAFKDLTTSHSVTINRKTLPGSNETHPLSQIDYYYNISAVNFGLQSPSGFAHKVRGSCYTEYSWLHPLRNSSALNIDSTLYNEYLPWGMHNLAGSYLEPSDISPYPTFKISVSLYIPPDSLSNDSQTNKSFALIPQLAHTPSFTPSTDPWYLTELRQDIESGAGYRIKSGRPALACWQESLFCINDVCSSAVDLQQSNFPKGLQTMLVERSVLPRITEIIASAGSASLKSTAGSGNSGLIDCASSTMKDDIDRLVEASYLATREVFRETALVERLPGVANRLLEGDQELQPGSSDFVMISGDVAALSLQALVAIPTCTLLIWFVVMLLTLCRRSIYEVRAGNPPPGKLDRYAALSSALSAPQLYRMLDEGQKTTGWRKRRSAIPLPPSRKDVNYGAPVPYFEDTQTVRLQVPKDPIMSSSIGNGQILVVSSTEKGAPVIPQASVVALHNLGEDGQTVELGVLRGTEQREPPT